MLPVADGPVLDARESSQPELPMQFFRRPPALPKKHRLAPAHLPMGPAYLPRWRNAPLSRYAPDCSPVDDVDDLRLDPVDSRLDPVDSRLDPVDDAGSRRLEAGSRRLEAGSTFVDSLRRRGDGVEPADSPNSLWYSPAPVGSACGLEAGSTLVDSPRRRGDGAQPVDPPSISETADPEPTVPETTQRVVPELLNMLAELASMSKST